MHPHKSTECQTTSNSLLQSVGGLYLGVVAALLFVVVLLAVDRSLTAARLGQMPLPEPAAAAPDTLTAAERAALYAKLAEMGEELTAGAAERNRLAKRLEELLTLRAELGVQAGGGKGGVEGTDDPRAALLRAIEETERELAAVSQALDAAERKLSTSQIEVAGLGARLNRALLAKVEELQKSRSDFFARLRGVLGDRPGFMVEGDRFALPSEVLFAPGSDRLTPQGVEEVRRLAATINAVRGELPGDVAWVLRVGGHTDKRPIANARFPSNWELSAMRAVTVVKTLIAAGIPPEHVVAAGFGEFQPVTTADDDEALARNRRIEFRLDQP